MVVHCFWNFFVIVVTGTLPNDIDASHKACGAVGLKNMDIEAVPCGTRGAGFTCQMPGTQFCNSRKL